MRRPSYLARQIYSGDLTEQVGERVCDIHRIWQGKSTMGIQRAKSQTQKRIWAVIGQFFLWKAIYWQKPFKHEFNNFCSSVSCCRRMTWECDGNRVEEQVTIRGTKWYEMNSVNVLNNKTPLTPKPCVFGVVARFLPHTMVQEGGSEAEALVRNLVDLFFSNLLIKWKHKCYKLKHN